MSEPLELTTIAQRTAEARQAFAHDVDQLLDGLLGMLEDADHLDVVSVKLTLQAMREQVREKFDQGRPPRPRDPGPVLQLVREAYDALTNPQSRVDLRDWTRAADAVLGRS